MNYKMTAYVLGKMLGVEALVLCIPAAVSLIYGGNFRHGSIWDYKRCAVCLFPSLW